MRYEQRPQWGIDSELIEIPIDTLQEELEDLKGKLYQLYRENPGDYRHPIIYSSQFDLGTSKIFPGDTDSWTSSRAKELVIKYLRYKTEYERKEELVRKIWNTPQKGLGDHLV